MKYLYSLCKTAEKKIPINAPKWALLLHMLCWFLAGCGIWVIGVFLFSGNKEFSLSEASVIGAAFSLVLGYAGGVVWLFRQEEP